MHKPMHNERLDAIILINGQNFNVAIKMDGEVPNQVIKLIMYLFCAIFLTLYLQSVITVDAMTINRPYLIFLQI